MVTNHPLIIYRNASKETGWRCSSRKCSIRGNGHFVSAYYALLWHLKIGKYQGLSWTDAGGPAPGWAGRVGLGRASQTGPARQISRGWAAARPSPSHFQNFTGRPGPAHHMAARPMRHGLYMGRPNYYVGRPVGLTGRPKGPIHVLSRTKRGMWIRWRYFFGR